MFMLDRLFRDKAVQRMGRKEPLDRMLRVTAPHEWMLLAGSGLSLLGFALWGVFGSMDLAVRSEQCVLARPGERHAVVSPHAGVVVDVLAATGDRVAAGQALARVRSPGIHREDADEMDHLVLSPRAGEVMALDLTPGRVVADLEPVGLVRDSGDDRLQALAFVHSEQAQTLDAGLPAQILVDDSGNMLEAAISDISPRPVPLPHWLATDDAPAYRVRATLSAGADADLPEDGAGCAMRVRHGTQAPIRLLLAQAD